MYVVRPVCPAAAVCIKSVLPTRGTLQYVGINIANKGFENTTYNDILGIGIIEILMSIISCHGFVNDTDSAVIFSYRRLLLLLLYIKRFVLHENI